MVTSLQHSESPLFFPFDPSPPPAEVCLENVYDAFSSYPFGSGWCERCFTPELEAEARRQRVRSAAAESFDMIYFEHPLCSGGAETFLHFLPRGLELSFFDGRLAFGLAHHFLKLGIFFWPEHEQSALRDLFCRVAISWFTEGHTAPLEGPTHRTSSWILQGDVPEYILQALLVLRIDARSIAEWLLRTDTPAAWHGIAKVLKDPWFIEAPVYFVLGNPAEEEDCKAACEAINRLTSDGFRQVITGDVLLGKWMPASESDPGLAGLIGHLESFLDVGTLVPRQRREDAFAVRKCVESLSSGENSQSRLLQ